MEIVVLASRIEFEELILSSLQVLESFTFKIMLGGEVWIRQVSLKDSPIVVKSSGQYV